MIQIAKKKKIRLDGILAQEFCEGRELIIGIKKDLVFGHCIVLGIGGIFAETLKDTSTRRCPVNEDDAQEMIDELQNKKVLYGFRGMKTNVKVIKEVLTKVSKIPIKYPKIEELDINPFMINEKGGKAVDARIVWEK